MEAAPWVILRVTNRGRAAGFVVKEDARGGKDAITFPIVHRDEVAYVFETPYGLRG